jgi:hypothetical protein
MNAIGHIDSASRARVLLGPDGRKLVAGVLLITAVLFGQQLYGWATAAHRLDPSLRDSGEARNVVVVLDFMPDRFHSERIRDYGMFAGRDGALNRIRLRNVSPENLRRLASIAWVARIEPMK